MRNGTSGHASIDRVEERKALSKDERGREERRDAGCRCELQLGWVRWGWCRVGGYVVGVFVGGWAGWAGFEQPQFTATMPRLGNRRCLERTRRLILGSHNI